MTGSPNIYQERADYSRRQLTELRKRLAKLDEVRDFPTLAIYGAGSYARLEASEHSDIDMFFLNAGDEKDISELRTKCMRLFGKVIDIIDDMGFPKLSNDCEYLVLLHTKEIVSNLGNRKDDHENYFTARMLLLLESQCVYGDEPFERITTEIVRSYFKDFPDHKQTFTPMFLLNDICRFWKTLLLNYEHKRKFQEGEQDIEERKTHQKVRNFKLKYSRMTTCFASIAALGSYLAPVTEEQVLEMTKLTPRQRLQSITSRIPEATAAVNDVLNQYAWFLEMTGLPTSDLEAHFSDKQQRTEMFRKANEYGDSMFRLLQTIDQTGPTLLRTLVI
jgi:predicted nucleotidyltransferase